jgi:hypothetical protein
MTDWSWIEMLAIWYEKLLEWPCPRWRSPHYLVREMKLSTIALLVVASIQDLETYDKFAGRKDTSMLRFVFN